MSRVDVPSVDETFELLSRPRGRLVLQYFDQHQNPIRTEKMAERIARWEHDGGDAPTDQSVSEVERALAEDLFPRLADLGLATYDANGDVIRYDAETITTALRNAEDVLAFLWDGGGDAKAESSAAADAAADATAGGSPDAVDDPGSGSDDAA
jgi:hypothetical protein